MKLSQFFFLIISFITLASISKTSQQTIRTLRGLKNQNIYRFDNHRQLGTYGDEGGYIYQAEIPQGDKNDLYKGITEMTSRIRANSFDIKKLDDLVDEVSRKVDNFNEDMLGRANQIKSLTDHYFSGSSAL